jgi:hypothetical protein
MPYSLSLPPPWPAQGWKVKIREKERTEPPHVTILWKTKAWRLGLRNRMLLDVEPNPSEIPRELLSAIEAGWTELCRKWDEMYPENPIASGD